MRLAATRSPMKPNEGELPHIVIVGGGVAGLILATRLGHSLGRRNLARISLIDRSWVHVWKPMLHTFAAGTWNIYEQQVQYVAHARAHHFEYVPGQLDAIDRAARRIRLAPLQAAGEVVAGGRELDYDVLVLAFGSRANDFGTPGVVEHCHFIDSPDQADAFNARLRAHVVRSFAEGGNIDIAIVGGGATGVELAAELSRMVELAAGYGKVGHPPAATPDPAGNRATHSRRIPGGGFRLGRVAAARAGRGRAHRREGRGRRRRGLHPRRRRACAGRAEGLGGGHPCIRQLRRRAGWS